MNDHAGISDELLLLWFGRGDATAFEELVDRYKLPLLSYCRAFSSSEDEAEDMVQETFLRVIKRAPDYRSTSRFSSWLFTIAHNLGLERNRVAANRRRLSQEHGHDIVDLATAGTGDHMPDRSPSIREALEGALRLLTPLEERTLRLTFYAGLSTLEIAQLQNCTRATVRVRRHKAIQKLRSILRVGREIKQKERPPDE